MKSIAAQVVVSGMLFGVLALLHGAASADEEIIVRPLKFMAKDPLAAFQLGGRSKAAVLRSAGDVETLVGKESAKALVSLVDFEREVIVLVSWTTSGPPEGKLKHEAMGMGKNRKVVFYVQGPPGGGIRGQRARIGADFFAVPRGITVEFEPKERN